MTKQDYEKYRITGRNADGDLMKSIVRSRKDAEATARYWRVQFNFTKVKIRGLELTEAWEKRRQAPCRRKQALCRRKKALG